VQDRPVTLAAVSGAHGVGGEVRLKLFGEGVASLKAHRAFNGGSLTLEKLKDDGKGGAIARFAPVMDGLREAAEAGKLWTPGGESSASAGGEKKVLWTPN
jgi:16S rRNA processing protein RimM